MCRCCAAICIIGDCYIVKNVLPTELSILLACRVCLLSKDFICNGSVISYRTVCSLRFRIYCREVTRGSGESAVSFGNAESYAGCTGEVKLCTLSLGIDKSCEVSADRDASLNVKLRGSVAEVCGIVIFYLGYRLSIIGCAVGKVVLED